MKNERCFEETKASSQNNLDGMTESLQKMRELYEKQTERGDAQSADETARKIAGLEMDIGFETDVFRQTFY